MMSAFGVVPGGGEAMYVGREWIEDSLPVGWEVVRPPLKQEGQDILDLNVEVVLCCVWRGLSRFKRGVVMRIVGLTASGVEMSGLAFKYILRKFESYR